MKRPNITPEEWNISKHATPEYAPQFGIHDGQHDFAIVKGDNAEANACAIAALPALLDALDELLATHELRGVKGETFTPLQIRAADAAKAALIQAGYTFD